MKRYRADMGFSVVAFDNSSLCDADAVFKNRHHMPHLEVIQ
jgi:hypothetical protein